MPHVPLSVFEEVACVIWVRMCMTTWCPALAQEYSMHFETSCSAVAVKISISSESIAFLVNGEEKAIFSHKNKKYDRIISLLCPCTLACVLCCGPQVILRLLFLIVFQFGCMRNALKHALSYKTEVEDWTEIT